MSNSQKKKRMLKKDGPVQSLDSETELECERQADKETELPEGTPEWGAKLLEIIQNEFKAVTMKLDGVDEQRQSNTKNIKAIEKKLARVEKINASLECENTQLKEKLLELEYQQKRNNLIFEGIPDVVEETDIQCMNKLRGALQKTSQD